MKDNEFKWVVNGKTRKPQNAETRKCVNPKYQKRRQVSTKMRCLAAGKKHRGAATQTTNTQDVHYRLINNLPASFPTVQ